MRRRHLLRAASRPAHQLGRRCRARRRSLRARRPSRWRDGRAPLPPAPRASSRSRRAWSRVNSGVSALIATIRPSRSSSGGVDNAHAAAADLLDDPVRPELPAGQRRRLVRARAPAATPQAGSSRNPAARAWLRRRVWTSCASSGSSGGMRREECWRSAGSRRAVVEQLVDLPPASGVHAGELPSSSRASHARATVQCASPSRARCSSLRRSPRWSVRRRTGAPRGAPVLRRRREPLERLVERDEIDAMRSPPATSPSSSVTRCRSPPRFCASRARARSIRIWRIECAAMAQKCARFCHRPGLSLSRRR